MRRHRRLYCWWLDVRRGPRHCEPSATQPHPPHGWATGGIVRNRRLLAIDSVEHVVPLRPITVAIRLIDINPVELRKQIAAELDRIMLPRNRELGECAWTDRTATP